MATPNVGILTNAGKNLIDQVNAGKTKITFSKIVFSSMNNNQLTDDQIKALTTVAPQEIVVNNPKVTLDTNTGETRIRATGNNEALTDGVYVKTYAVYAKDDSGNEILYGITVSPNPNYLPEYDGVTPQAVTYSYKVNISNTSNITFTNSNDIYVSDTDLAEALQPYAKTVDVNQQLDKKVVDNKDGTEQLNGVQVQPYNKLSDVTSLRNIALQTDNAVPYTAKGTVGELVQSFSLYSGFSALPSGTQVYYSYDLVVTNADGGVHWLGWVLPWSPFVQNQPIKTDGIHHFQGTTTIPDNDIISGQTIKITIDDSHATYQIKNLMIVVGSIPVTHLPAPEDKVNVSDMRKPASDVVGLDEIKSSPLPDGTDLYTLINTSGQPLSYHVPTYVSAQTMVNKPTAGLSAFKLNTASIGDNTIPSYNYTFLTLKDESDGSIYEAFLNTDESGAITVVNPWYKVADDSKVAHLSGANNFDTVPTVNNNPLLLASSLPSDLARTGSDQEFTGKNTFDTAPIDKTTGNPYITKDGIPSDVARTGQANTFTAAQIFSIAPTIKDASTDKGDNQAATMADLKSVENSAWRVMTGSSDFFASFTCLYKINTAKKRIELIAFGETNQQYIGTIVDLSSIISGITSVDGWFNYIDTSGSSVNSEVNFSGTKLTGQTGDYARNEGGGILIHKGWKNDKMDNNPCYVYYTGLV